MEEDYNEDMGLDKSVGSGLNGAWYVGREETSTYWRERGIK